MALAAMLGSHARILHQRGAQRRMLSAEIAPESPVIVLAVSTHACGR